jgi:MYXO-CTERM domain-containing protein
MRAAFLQRGFNLVLNASTLAVLTALSTFAPSRAHAVCSAPTTCICEEWPKAHVVRGSVRDRAGEMSQVEVSEVLAGQGVDPIEPGDVIQGVLESPTCGLSLGSFFPGDDVLALWQGTMPDPMTCPEFVDCDEANCAGWGSNPDMARSCRTECLEQTRDACPANQPRLVLVPWRTELELGEGRTLSSDAVSVLADRYACNARFAPPTQPCNDVVLVPAKDGCSVGAVGSPSPERQHPLIGWLFGFGIVFGLTRARRRVPR